MCKRDSNLAQAEVIIQFIDSKLKEIDPSLSRILLNRLRIRYVKRKNLNSVSLVKVYSGPDILNADAEQEYTESTFIRNAKSLHQRLFKQKNTNSDGDSSAIERDLFPSVGLLVVHPPSRKRSSGLKDSQATPTSADSNPTPLAKELSDLLKGSETDTIKEIRRVLFVVPPTRWNHK